MRLYYMTSLETLEDHVLPHARIRVSTFDKVNDPFELFAISQSNKTSRQKFSWLYEHWSKTLGFISMSETWSSPLMWAHYGKNHTGVCLGIEVPDGKAMKVLYETSRLQMVLAATKLETAVDDEIIRTVVTTKYKEWEYEREWRLLERLEHPDPETSLHYLDFSPDLELREIILGARCERPMSDIRKQVYGNTGEIVMKKLRPAFQTFSMVPQKQATSMTISPLHRVCLR
jgi:hypothetical protein